MEWRCLLPCLEVVKLHCDTNPTSSERYAFKIPSLTLVSSWLCSRMYSWHMSQPSFNLGFENLACLATLKSNGTNKTICWLVGFYGISTLKQFVCGSLYIYIYLLIFYLPAFMVTKKKKKKTPEFRDNNI